MRLGATRAPRRSTILRLVALAFLLQFAGTGVVLGLAWLQTREQVERDQRAIVAELRTTLQAEYASGGVEALAQLIGTRVGTPGVTSDVIALATPDGRIIAGNLQAWPPLIPSRTTWQVVELYRVGGTTPERIGLTVEPLPGGLRLLTGHVIDRNLRFLAVSAEAMLAAAALSVPLALLMAALIGQAISRRLTALTATAAKVTAGDLSERVVRDGSNDAFDALGGAVNMMLARIERLVEELRVVTDGMAHDLRSPLTRLRSALERAQERAGDTVGDDIAIAQRETAAVLAMLDTALEIGRAEAGLGRERFEPLDPAAVLGDLAEIYGPVAEQRGLALRLDVAPLPPLTGHRDLLTRALANLIDNALNYADGATTLTLAAGPTADGTAFSVTDDGVGIPAERVDEALRRYSRLDPARGVTGHGLGLALVQAVAELHDGALRLGEAGPGLRATLLLGDPGRGAVPEGV